MEKAVLAIDAALNHSGYCVARGNTIIETGVFTVSPRWQTEDKLLAIMEWAGGLIERHGAGTVVLEGQYTTRNARTAYALSLVHGVIMAAARARGARVEVISPARVKKAATGRGNATKEEVATAVAALYGLAATGTHADDITDAVAIYHAHISETGEAKEAGGSQKGKRGSRKHGPEREALRLQGD